MGFLEIMDFMLQSPHISEVQVSGCIKYFRLQFFCESDSKEGLQSALSAIKSMNSWTKN